MNNESPRQIVVIRGHDRPGALKSILNEFGNFHIEAAWLRSFGDRGAILLMVRDQIQFSGSHSLANRVADVCRKVSITLDSQREGGQSWISAVPVDVDPDLGVAETSFSPGDAESAHHLIFTIHHPKDDTADGNGYRVPNAFNEVGNDFDLQIAQHDSYLSLDRSFIKRIFRVYARPRQCAVVTKEKEQSYSAERLKNKIWHAVRKSWGDDRAFATYDIPSTRDVAGISRTFVLARNQKFVYFEIVCRDRSGLYTDYYTKIVEMAADHAPLMTRSCCRGLGGVAVLMYAIRVSNLPDGQEERWKAQLEKEFAQDFSSRELSRIEVRAESKISPYNLTGSSSLPVVGISKIGFHQDWAGSLLRTVSCLASDQTSIYQLDAQPTPRDNRRFALRLAVMHPDRSSASQLAQKFMGEIWAQESRACDSAKFDIGPC